jgi:hypothetical protein
VFNGPSRRLFESSIFILTSPSDLMHSYRSPKDGSARKNDGRIWQ